jgi:predicted nuclease of predicted toxin-antitoxin system
VRFLADESCDFAVVRALRAAGHDVVAVADQFPRAEDPVVIELALAEGRIVLTEDKDFGQLVYASGRESHGVIFMRFPAYARATLPAAITRLVEEAGDQLMQAFVVVRPGRVRISHRPLA